jgi:hypothetical protein
MSFGKVLVGAIWLAAFAAWAQEVPGQPSGGMVRDEPPQMKAPPLSPPANTSVKIGNARIAIRYSAPSMRKRAIFGGLVPYDKVWRAGANDATALHTDADLEIGDLAVPKGDYTLFVLPRPDQWLLIVNKQTGQSGLDYDQAQDLGRVAMTLGKLPKPVERFRITLSRPEQGNSRLEMAWENTVATVPVKVK